MERIKQIQTTVFKGIAVEVPEGANTWVNPDLKKYIHVGDIDGDVYSLELPFDYEIVGKSTEITEEQCAEIVEAFINSEVDHGAYRIDETFAYPDFTDEENAFDSALESLASLMQSIGCEPDKAYVILRRIEG